MFIAINAHLWILFIMATAPNMRDLTELATVASTIAEVFMQNQHLTPRISQVQHLQGKFLLLYSGIAAEGLRGACAPNHKYFINQSCWFHFNLVHTFYTLQTLVSRLGPSFSVQLCLCLFRLIS